jgi:2-methylcitrate dehydratase PrpD
VSQSPTAILASYVADASLTDVPGPVVEKIKELLLDHLGCALGGSRTPLARAALEATPGRGSATVAGTGITTAPGFAAFANALAANALDYDDTGPTGHPGATIIPAALALAESRDQDGNAFLLALLVGYETWAHIAAAIQPGWERRIKVYGNGVTQTFGAAAACARLLGLDGEQTLCAFGLAGAFAPLPHDGKMGWDEGCVSWVKDNVAWPAEGGLRAAVLAKAGFLATREILDGERGLWLMAGSDRCDFDRMVSGVGSRYDVLGVSLKPYPCCRWIHSTLDAVRELTSEHEIHARDVRQVSVRSMEPLAEWFQIRRPITMVDAEFSVPHAVAMVLLRRPRPEWWREENRSDPAVLALMDRVVVEVDPHAQATYAEHRNSARIPSTVVVETDEGTFERARDDCHGGAADPMSWEEIELKFRELAQPVLGERRASAVLRMVAELERVEGMSRLGRALSA